MFESYWKIIRKAALNKDCLELYYTGSKKETKRYELIPISVRGSKSFKLTLYAYDISEGKIKQYRSDRIERIDIMEGQKWPIEVSQIGYPIEVAYQECFAPKGAKIVPMGESNRPEKNA